MKMLLFICKPKSWSWH